MKKLNVTWEDAILKMIAQKGGEASLKDIYDPVIKIKSETDSNDSQNVVRSHIRRLKNENKIRYVRPGTYALFSFDEAVQLSLGLTTKDRKKRLKSARAKPTATLTEIKIFARNPDVVAEVLLRAKGKCEACKKSAPFKRKKDGQPYLEVHHKKQLAKGGLDTVKNAIALCPNCHRKAHYG